MKRLFFIIISFITIASFAKAEDYRIVQINTGSVLINGNSCKAGDIFSDTDTITWSSDKQAMKAVNQSTHVMKVFFAKEFHKNYFKSVKDYLVSQNHLSVRAGQSVAAFKASMGREFYLFDTLVISHPLVINDNRYVTMTYSHDGTSQTIKVPGNDSTLFITRSLFPFIQDNSDYVLNATMQYHNNRGAKLTITDRMIINIISTEE